MRVVYGHTVTRRINYGTYMDKGYVIVIKTAYADSIYTKTSQNR